MNKDEFRIYMRARKSRLKDAGICPHCEKVKADEGHVVCASCRKKSSAKEQRRQARLSPEYRPRSIGRRFTVEAKVAKAERIAQLKRMAA